MYPLISPQQLPTDPGLVAYYPGDEGTGRKVYDASGKGNTGTLINGVTWGVGAKGKGFGLKFDGVDDYVNLSNPPSLQINDPFTLSMFFKQLSAPVAYPGLLGHGTNGWAFGISTESGNVGKVFLGQSGQAPYLNSTTVLSNNLWYHLAVTRAGVTSRMYINAIEESSSASSPTFTFANPLSMGTDSDLGYDTINGVFAEVRIYNRALKAQEIKRLYEQPRF